VFQAVLPSRARIAVLLAALSLAFPAAGSASEATSQGPAVPVSAITIDNFGQVDSNYYRGARPTGHEYADLAALGVKTVIDLTSDDADASERAMAEQAGLRYVQIPMTTHEPPTLAQLAEFLGIVTQPANLPVYVHCVGGRHRTGVMTAVYRIAHDGWNAERAFSEMKRYKFGADFLHPEFKAFVYAYRPRAASATIAHPVAADAAR
jgi:protein tyrosine/serine phosphatase